MYYIDLGSSTIKVYQYSNKKLELMEEKSILFKDYYTKEHGINEDCYANLLDYFRKLSYKNIMNKGNCKIYATGIWREIPVLQAQTLKVDFSNINLNFNIISEEEENFYFQKAMQGIYNRKKVLMVNMGGKTTELVLVDKGNITGKNNLKIGVADILEKFPMINDIEKCPKAEEIMDYGLKILENEKLDYDPDCAVFTGGELRFQKLLKYNLVPNDIFWDDIHQYMVSYDDLSKKNEEILYHVSIDELYNLMPNNPVWMSGAKAGAFLGQIIFHKTHSNIIVPSDLNIMHGIVKLEG